MIIGLLFWLLVVIFHNELALTFSYSEAALQVVNKLSLLLAFTILLNSIQPVLRGSIRLLSKDFTLSSTLPRHRRGGIVGPSSMFQIVSRRGGGWIRAAIIRGLHELGMLLSHWGSHGLLNGLDLQPGCYGMALITIFYIIITV